MSLILNIKVTPRSGRSHIMLDASGNLKIYLKSAPEDGKANKELIKLFSKRLRCPQAAITIVSGAASRTKKIHIDLSLSYDQLLAKLELAIQTSLI